MRNHKNVYRIRLARVIYLCGLTILFFLASFFFFFYYNYPFKDGATERLVLRWLIFLPFAIPGIVLFFRYLYIEWGRTLVLTKNNCYFIQANGEKITVDKDLVTLLTLYESNAGLLGLWVAFKYIVIETGDFKTTVTNLLVDEKRILEFFHQKEIRKKKVLFPYPMRVSHLYSAKYMKPK